MSDADAKHAEVLKRYFPERDDEPTAEQPLPAPTDAHALRRAIVDATDVLERGRGLVKGLTGMLVADELPEVVLDAARTNVQRFDARAATVLEQLRSVAPRDHVRWKERQSALAEGTRALYMLVLEHRFGVRNLLSAFEGRS